jgi:hypothetical protein
VSLDSQAREVALEALRQVALAAVVAYVGRVYEQVDGRLAGGESAGVAYPEALRMELEQLRRATE